MDPKVKKEKRQLFLSVKIGKNVAFLLTKVCIYYNVTPMQKVSTLIQNTHVREWTIKGLAALGLFAILAFGACGVSRIALSLPPLFASLGAAAVSLSTVFIPNERLEIDMPEDRVISGETFTLSWAHSGKRGEGTYTVSFACREGLSAEAETREGTFARVYCETPFNFTNAEKTIRIVPTSQVRFLDVPFTVSFTRLADGAVTASAETMLLVFNEDTEGSLSTTTRPQSAQTSSRQAGSESRKTYAATSVTPMSDSKAKSDLSARIVSLGTLDASGAYTVGQSVRAGSRAAVRFEIENVGTKTAEFWSFNAVLPTSPYFIFHSETQPRLAPGDKIQYTLGFDQIDKAATGGVVTINVDPANSIPESSEDNNIATGTYTIILP